MTHRDDTATRQLERERVRNSTLLRAEYVLPLRPSSSEPEPVEVVDQPAQKDSPSSTDHDEDRIPDSLQPLHSAETDVKIARAQLLNRVRAFARIGNQDTRTALRRLSTFARGFAVALVVGAVAVPVVLMGRKRQRFDAWVGGYTGNPAPLERLAPLRSELIDVAGVTLAHWARRLFVSRR